MKHILKTLLLAATAASAFSSCNKDDETVTPPPPPAVACDGMNFCMKVDGTTVSKNATWRVINGTRNRVYWEEGSGNNYKNVEIDMYGTNAGSYSVAASPGSGQAGFQYYINDNGTMKNIQGESGTVEATEISGNTITGTFSVTAKDDNGTMYQIAEGNFIAVPQ